MKPVMRNLPPKFVWISLGVEGGINESNLNAYLLAPYQSSDFICLDAGTLFAGLQVAANNGCFHDIPMQDQPDQCVESVVLKSHVKAYLISHSFLDHLHGLVSVSPNDTPKPIIGLPETIDGIRDSIFNWVSWPNMGNEGKNPVGQYQYQRLSEGRRTPIENTSMHVEALSLAHSNSADSAAFLIDHDGHYVLYMGDTGPDEVEQRTTTEDLWKRIAPLIRENRLHMITIEASFVDSHPEELLFGHLTPKWILKSFRKLALMVEPNQPQQALAGLKVVIAHIKPCLLASKPDNTRQIIEQQLASHNDLGIHFILVSQGTRLEF
ncbi:MAG: 3',5'-cyclic-nucleotide phosphodiesterase [Zetaproteobacteria bacterium CG_4_9_14_3_um_filter_49_83]|nr:MAG: hypothetical protein AUJ56_01510 [Zetaproteobacteria bacterium CG1_02_49_23]PIQ31014.1 MAG: 3',5'-cyclic-nucleotide phosphodiesterase [Zetaproteobacteria bacterium CG17_big_fil_post_rev_8_21_14_2_50_50_13]PIV30949.1 MAG: 3',5'-cyclic-nucleotide phosphodiesterase [Zetaproteobacteria bacterium CG02_land_8_20_14_3_00_50_9]PIY56899.1 MAG: 3',5'-cyclic-nucleotide phosphodiesterase [Zetaproteobacteria bacterium CG_4_10_14_0_8_um_filter_49_80]PJA35844.1 MAG: 3',5'-cyclic-nucleotide phosphodies